MATLELTNTALPYSPAENPVPQQGKGAYYAYGRDVLTSYRNLVQRRPGFSTALEPTPTAFNGTIKNIFQWQRWSGAYIWMVNEVISGVSKVYKLELGTDASFVLIHTDLLSTNPFYFIVTGNYCYFGNGVDMMKYDGTTVTNWGITAPSATPTVATGAGTLTGDYKYAYCYGSSTSGHISSPSVVSALISPAGQSVDVGVTASTDSQVDRIHIFRTTAGGDGIFFEISGSPFANSTTTRNDNTADSALSGNSLITTSSASRSKVNDPPPAAKGFVLSSNRIWMFETNKVWYTKFEEDSTGVLAECVPGGSGGNYFPFDNEVLALGACEDGVLVYTAKSLHKIEGQAQSEFRRYTLANGRGARNQALVSRNGRATGWVDTANQVWGTDSYKFEETGKPIRVDIAGFSHSQGNLCFHEDDEYRWMVLNDAGAGFIRIFDMDTEQWMPPWTVSSSFVASGESAAGDTVLVAVIGGVLRQMTAGVFNDGGGNYTSSLGTCLVPVSNKGGMLEDVVIEYAGSQATVKRQFDDDPRNPSLITYSTLTSQAPEFITQGTYLRSSRYPEAGVAGSSSRSGRGRRMSLLLEWPEDGTDFKLYSIKTETRLQP